MSFKRFPDFVRFQIPMLIWMAFIFVLSSIPGSAYARIDFHFAHLIAHTLLFGMLYFLAYRALKYQHYSRLISEFSLLGSLLLVVLYGASDEYHQSFTPGRSEELKDLLIDVSAAIVVLIVVMLVERIRYNRRKLEAN